MFASLERESKLQKMWWLFVVGVVGQVGQVGKERK
jgi:hypothetical protein